jgi:hypothetical protein
LPQSAANGQNADLVARTADRRAGEIAVDKWPVRSVSDLASLEISSKKSWDIAPSLL